MFNLREYRNKFHWLSDFLPWAALIGEGVILNKDGSFQRSAKFRGPDLESSTPAELVSITARLNSALRRLGTGWTVFVEAQRVPAQHYPRSVFVDPVASLVDKERGAQFREDGQHFESHYFLTLVWVPPAEDASRTEGWFYDGQQHKGANPRGLVKAFGDRCNRLLQLMEGFFPEIFWLDDAATLSYLHSCCSTKHQSVRVFETPMNSIVCWPISLWSVALPRNWVGHICAH